MKERPSIAKITRPRLRDIFPRKRLFNLFDASVNLPLTWVSGPAGCGKTSFVASYLDEKELPCICYQVDEGDSDIASFFYYLGLAAKKAAPRRRKPIPLLTPEYLLGIPTFTLRFFENLYSRLNPPSFLVFDNCHHLTPDSPFHEVILNGLSAIPDGFNFIMISRNEPPPGYARLRANRQMGLIGWNDLRFTPCESSKMIALRAPEIDSKEMMDGLHTITDGWIAGLILILEGVKQGIEVPSLGKSAPEEIVDYFGSEVFNRTGKRFRTFLMQTASLPKMTEKMVQALTGLPNAVEMLTVLTKNNYFIEKRALAEPVFQYHPLFRNFLIIKAKDFFSPAVLADLHHHAALLLEESGQLEEAAWLFIEEKNWEGLAELALRQAPHLLAQGRNKTLEEWLNHFPSDMIQRFPWLLYWKGICRLPFDPVEARLTFEHVFHLFVSGEDEAGTLLAWSGVVECVSIEYDEFSKLDAWMDWLNRWMEHHPSFPSIEIEARVATNMAWANVYRRTDDSDNTESWLDQAFQLSRKMMDVNLILQNGTSGIYYHMMKGETAKCGMMLEEIRSVALSFTPGPVNRMVFKVLEAFYHENLGDDPRLQLQPISEGLDIAESNGIHVVDHLLFSQGVYGSLSLGDLAKAEIFLKKMESAIKPGPRYITSHFHFLLGWCLFLRDRIPQAFFHAEIALKLAIETGTLIPEIVSRLLLSHILHSKGELEEAWAQIVHVRGLIDRNHFHLFEYYVSIIEALFVMDQGDEKRCIESLTQGLAFGKKFGLKNMLFIWQPAAMARLCALALEKGIEEEYVRDLILTFRLPSDGISFKNKKWPWPLAIYTSGRFGILKDEKPIRFSRKTQEKPLTLLKALIALGGRDVREEDLSDILWPEADGDAAHRSFEITLHRLRGLTGCSEALPFRDGRLTLDSRYCWVDIWAFERLLSQVEIKQKQGWTDDVISLAHEVIELYKGPFLENEAEQPWLISTRERFRSKYLRHVGRLADYWSQTKQWEKALDCYQKGMEVDELAEEFCRGMMICYQNLGLKANALSLYNRFEKRLKAVLGVEPSLQTKTLRNTLLGGT